jgi:hypothetical protein
MISCPRDVFRDSLAYSVVAKAGAAKVVRPRTQMSGNSVDGGNKLARVLEYALPGGEVVARLVEACGCVETWLRRDLATETLVARADAFAEKERIIKQVTDYARATRQKSRDQMAETYVLSSALIHAAVRHQSRIGRLHDMNSRGDRVRDNLAAALERAAKAEAEGAK